MELIISIVIAFLVVEVYAWLPKISARLLERAVCRLRAEDQERCREEWKAGLNDLPNTIAQLVHALSYSRAADRINADIYATKLTEIDNALKDISVQHTKHVEQLRELIAHRQQSRTKLDHAVDGLKHQCSLLRADAPVGNEKLANSIQNATRAVEEFTSVVVAKLDRARELLNVSIDSTNSRLDHIGRLIQMVSKKRCQVFESLRKGNVSWETFETLQAGITSDLETIKNIFEDDNWGNDEAMRQHENIITTLQRVLDDTLQRQSRIRQLRQS